MAKKKSVGKFSEGTRVKVREGINSPEFPDVSLAGWTGTVNEVSGKPPSVSCVIEWDDATVKGMPSDYVKRCEQDGLYHLMAFLPEDALDSAS